MATDYKLVVVPDIGGTRPCIECPQCLGLQLLFVLWSSCLTTKQISGHKKGGGVRGQGSGLDRRVPTSMCVYAHFFTQSTCLQSPKHKVSHRYPHC